MPSISKILIANRGEIALRVMRTCHALGISSVAVYSEPDAGLPFVAAADEAVALGGASAHESYLAMDKILAAAMATGADAIHPGYGFLAENAAFAQACADAGVTFIGPSAEVIRKLGGKREAKALAQAAGVPTVPGYLGAEQRTDALVEAARELGFPLLLKASAGGGGKGMHVVNALDEVAAAVERARREAAAAFGDGTLLLERYLERPRHLEVQILGDWHGNLVHLYERECSIQRRHQKILEEAPAPGLPEAVREAMYKAALTLGRAVGYQSAGTVEFIADGAELERSAAQPGGRPAGGFYFLEVNTRLQVEHPVTEAICGVDLVAEQIRVARGERLRFTEPPPRRGHAIEVRLCAEDPARGYLPTTGTLAALAIEGGAATPGQPGPGVRCDVGVVAGSPIGIHYDSMLGKLIAHGHTRAEAAAQLRRGLTRGLVAGLITNVDLLARLLGHPAFLAAELDTQFLARHALELHPPPAPLILAEAALAATLAGIAARGAQAEALAPPAWRNVPYRGSTVRYHVGEQVVEVSYQSPPPGARERLRVRIGERELRVDDYRLRAAPGGGHELELVTSSAAADPSLGGHRRRLHLAQDQGTWWVAVDGHTLALREEPRFPERRAVAAAGSLLAPMPGKVVKVAVEVGQEVIAGAPIAIVEAMKMEHTVAAAAAGTVTRLLVTVGDQVAAGALIAVVEAPGPT